MSDPGLAEIAPLLRRVMALDPNGLVRLRGGQGRLTAFAPLPFAVLAVRAVALAADAPSYDRTVRASDQLAWQEGEPDAVEPANRDADWRGATPPGSGWRRVDVVPDEVVRGLVRSGALALKDAAAREGVPGAQPRAEVADALLDAIVLTVDGDGGAHAEVPLRLLSALTRMGFLPRGSQAAVDVHGRWTRVVGEYGSICRQASGGGLGLLR